MATFKSFKALRPKPEFAKDIASRPYDVLNATEARDEAKGNNLSFLRVIKPEIELPEEIDPYDQKVYDKGLENLKKLSSKGYLIKEQKASYYVYRLTMEGREQTGIVGCCDYQEYYDGRIKKHELTRTVKENDRVRHVETQNANAEPVFFSYRGVQNINLLIQKIVTFEPVYNFISEDEIKHELWIVNDDKDISLIEFEFNAVPDLYVADGHHRTAAAARVGQKKKDDNPGHNGTEEYNFFMAVLFSDDQLKIYDYNRVVQDLNGKSPVDFISELEETFYITKLLEASPPNEKGLFSMYLENQWYSLKPKDRNFTENPKADLDVTFLSEKILSPILGIEDLRKDTRIDFVGGIRGLNELERRVDSKEMKVAFALFPVSMDELISIADAGEIMPPKTTWFEPKLRSGLFIHELE
tara:strand:+ start:2794 stop:4032 length:1239 start_codon:yes stop_codon:yes gene_type:complete